ncbi:hypothetical protein AGDE_00180 [Angomonas deanei]|uniref:Proteasome maturation factor UMP1, putative n=1 Tax=Angomonas deanei TaxID=59799 RepID=S9VH30_9TRYP|nr:hypothetical protein AGDE_03800 [Angomonas deanei]EPY43741.1 hypothetical protein AGDE_00180 [Angomonas deanei]CAD2217485.1 Proteasome maturation factor UMP1, putative [Angomonas deanei]|eukprot:EPY40128.1 hypothetical protein AGDE_03800 [Angomonas deanei]
MQADIRLPAGKAVEEKVMHPVEFIQKSSFQQEEALRMNRIRSTHGLGAAMEVALTERTLLNSHRIGSIPSSYALYNSYRGNVSSMDTFDVLGLLEHNPNVQPSSRAIGERNVYGRELTMKSVGLV